MTLRKIYYPLPWKDTYRHYHSNFRRIQSRPCHCLSFVKFEVVNYWYFILRFSLTYVWTKCVWYTLISLSYIFDRTLFGRGICYGGYYNYECEYLPEWCHLPRGSIPLENRNNEIVTILYSHISYRSFVNTWELTLYWNIFQ